MPKYAVKTKEAPPKKEEPQVEPTKQDAAILNETDELMDEIDALLEENAEEFVRGYVQKGGE